ncbi:hypothetical protein [Paenibacillus oleatilyticus]|uniref:Glycosyltransferase n=1 Tax=Paenibacillus oleatilyticus TaxID=2594886 RepID=A0ABV4V999_9BACL|nr:hypothetical protein [Paenibacillus oleatilyticus]MBU7317590.1 hypothetical protein [Paenibacillus oleatilyticus]
MMLGLAWIIGCYAAGVAIIHWLHWQWRRCGKPRTTHYVLQTYNNQLQVEWYLRSLYFFSWMKGKAISVTLADEGSTDDTLAIARRLSLEHQLSICTIAERDLEEWVLKHADEQVVVVRLNQNEGLETAFKYM